MRIYKSDGSFVDAPEDTEFGWSFSEIIIDETVPSYQARNRDRLTFSALRKSCHPPPIGDESVDFGDKIQETRPVIIKRHDPKIKIYPAKTVIEVGAVEGVPQDRCNKLRNIDAAIPAKQQVANLINPCSVESKMLLSVVHFAKYKHLLGDPSTVNLGDLKNNSQIKFLINDKNEEEDLKSEIENYHDSKEDNMLSLMMELILTDMKCDVDDLSNHQRNPVDSSDLGNSIKSDDSEEGACSLKPSEDLNRSENLSSFGFCDAIDRSIEKICEETFDIHQQIREIKKSFDVDEIKVNSLIDEAQRLVKSLRETRYLEELLHLLDGDLDKVVGKKWPFRVFLHPGDVDDANLIV